MTSSACISSLILLSLIIAYGKIGTLFVPIDAVINVISLMLMTTYYSPKYFRKLCFLIILLCKWLDIKNDLNILTLNTVVSQSKITSKTRSKNDETTKNVGSKPNDKNTAHSEL